MSEDETDRLIMSTFKQVARADENATVLRGFAIAAIAIAFVLALIILIAALGTGLGGADAGQAELAVLFICLGILFLGFFLWALLKAFANLVSGGARTLEIQAVNLSLAVGMMPPAMDDEDKDGASVL